MPPSPKRIPSPNSQPVHEFDGKEIIVNKYFGKQHLTVEEALDCIGYLNERILLHERNRGLGKKSL